MLTNTAFSELLFKTIKYHPTFPALTKFGKLKKARKWCIQFVHWYNHKHLHSGLKFITPHQRHNGDDKITMAKRTAVYQLAKAVHPERWSKNIRNWSLPEVVTLNPDKIKLKAEFTKETNLMKAA